MVVADSVCAIVAGWAASKQAILWRFLAFSLRSGRPHGRDHGCETLSDIAGNQYYVQQHLRWGFQKGRPYHFL